MSCCSDDGLFLHATLSTADLALSTISAEGGGLEAKQSAMEAAQLQGGSQPQQRVDAYLFSDEDATDEDVLPLNDVLDEVVPDSSDEASTGPALDMDMDLDIDLVPAPLVQGGPAMGAFIQQDEPMQASASASSATRKGVFTRRSTRDREFRMSLSLPLVLFTRPLFQHSRRLMLTTLKLLPLLILAI
jgi:hypothetical protein